MCSIFATCQLHKCFLGATSCDTVLQLAVLKSLHFPVFSYGLKCPSGKFERQNSKALLSKSGVSSGNSLAQVMWLASKRITQVLLTHHVALHHVFRGDKQNKHSIKKLRYMRTLAMLTVLKIEHSGRHTVFKRPTLSSLFQRKGEIRNNELEERDCVCVCVCV